MRKMLISTAAPGVWRRRLPRRRRESNAVSSRAPATARRAAQRPRPEPTERRICVPSGWANRACRAGSAAPQREWQELQGGTDDER